MGCSNNVPSTNETSRTNGDARWNIIFVLGSPVRGKRTQCDKIKAKYKIIIIHVGIYFVKR